MDISFNIGDPQERAIIRSMLDAAEGASAPAQPAVQPQAPAAPVAPPAAPVAPAPAAPAATAPGNGVDTSMLTEKLKAATRALGPRGGEVGALIQAYGVTKVSELSIEQLQSVVTQAEGLVSGG